jgi:hypothetical protein
VPWSKTDIPARELSCVLFELMGWQSGWKHKITANYFSKKNEQAIIFDLNCCESRFRDKENQGNPIRVIPSEWLSEFGEYLPEYMMSCRRALAEHLDSWDIDALPSGVEGFIKDINALTRNEAERMIEEMGINDE